MTNNIATLLHQMNDDFKILSNELADYDTNTYLETCRQKRMDSRAVLADEKTSYFVFFSEVEMAFWAKCTVQCSDEVNHNIASKLSKWWHC